jgi:hypothetical protein
MWQPAVQLPAVSVSAEVKAVRAEARRAQTPNEPKPRSEGIGERASAGMGQLRLPRRAVATTASEGEGEQIATNWEEELQFMRGGLSCEPRETPVGGSVLAQYVQLWKLDECAAGQSLLLCEYQRAENLMCTRVRKEMAAGCSAAEVLRRVRETQLTVAQRDAYGLVFYPEDTLTTLTVGGARRWYVGGGHRLAGGLLQASEVAALMGFSSYPGKARGRKRARAEMWAAVERTVPAHRRWDAAADSIPMALAEPLMQVAAEGARSVRRKVRRSGSARSKPRGSAARATGPLRYASIGSGACDVLFHALREVAGPMGGATHEWAAELEEDRQRAVAEATFTRRVHTQALSEAVFHEASVDILAVTWSCKGVSTAPHVGQKESERRAWSTVADMVAATEGYAKRGKPRVIVMEQASGLATHHRKAHAWLNERMRALPYVWKTGVFSAADYGGTQGRLRVLWVGTAV